MKKTTRIAAILLIGGTFAASARADDSTPTVTETLSMQDPDGTPYVISHPKSRAPSTADIDAASKSDQQANANKDWLLRAYEQQLQQKTSGDSGDQSNNLYYRIASDKNLSKLAGVSAIDSPADTHAALKAGAINGNQSTVGLRPDATPVAAPNTSPTTPIRPLITPLGAADAAGLHNFYSSLPTVQSVQVQKKNTNPADLDIPGKVAADSDPMAKDSLTFDSLPDDTGSSKSSRHDSSQLELPTTSNAAQIQKLNNTAMTAPGSTRTTPPSAINVSAEQLKIAAEPPPQKIAAPSPVRQPISSPFSILDR